MVLGETSPKISTIIVITTVDKVVARLSLPPSTIVFKRSTKNIVASDDDVAAEIKKLAEMYHVTEDQVKASVPVSEIAKDLVVGKAVDLIKEAAVITEVKEKTAAKKIKRFLVK